LSFQKGLESASLDALKYLRGTKIIGLGSGSSVAQVVRAMKAFDKKENLLCIPTSLQIKIEAEKSQLTIGDESLIPRIDVVFDGADQIDSKLNMIKGGGGALLREKILISAARKVVILASAPKFVNSLSRQVPVEVHPMARTLVEQRLSKMGAKKTELRSLDKGYPFVTENGNLVLDASFGNISNPAKMETELKCIAGVMEAGIFTRRPDSCYSINENGTFKEVT
jgi:ribose 5-phosphate isomerase A